MDILIVDRYKIVPNKYSWDLYVKFVVTEESLKKAGKKTKSKVGDVKWRDEGCFTNLQTLIQKVIRMESERNNDTEYLYAFIKRWEDMLQEVEASIGNVK